MRSVADTEFSEISMWIQLHNLPLACMNQHMVRRIGEQVGSVTEVETGEGGWCLGKFVRVRITRSINEPLVRCVPILTEGTKEPATVLILYEKLPELVCYACGKIGHHVRHCDAGEEAKVNLKFGNWLRAGKSIEYRRNLAPQKALITQAPEYTKQQAVNRPIKPRPPPRDDGAYEKRGTGRYLAPPPGFESGYSGTHNDNEEGMGENEARDGGSSTLSGGGLGGSETGDLRANKGEDENAEKENLEGDERGQEIGEVIMGEGEEKQRATEGSFKRDENEQHLDGEREGERVTRGKEKEQGKGVDRGSSPITINIISPVKNMSNMKSKGWKRLARVASSAKGKAKGQDGVSSKKSHKRDFRHVVGDEGVMPAKKQQRTTNSAWITIERSAAATEQPRREQ